MLFKLTPNSIHRWIGRDKQGNNLYKATFYLGTVPHLGWLFKLIHKWDTLIANRFVPSLNLGFDTLTVNSNAGGDGTISNTGANYATVRNAADGQNVYDTATDAEAGQNQGAAGPWYYMGRGYMPFNTNGIPTAATITGVVLTLYAVSVATGAGDSLVIVQSTQASNTALALADWDQLGTTSGGSKPTADITVGATFNIVFNATGISWINKTGYTPLGSRMSGDINNATPTANTSTVRVYWSNNTTNKPTLTVTYSLPSGGFFALMT